MQRREIKICGITTLAAAHTAAASGASLLGFVFVAESPRYIDPEKAAEISKNLPASIKPVGLFCDPDLEQLLSVTRHCSLDYIQLHGQEDLTFCKRLASVTPIPLIKAIGIGDDPATDIKKASHYKNAVDMLLFDAKPHHQDITSGGLGRRFDWAALKNTPPAMNFLLAGGLTPQNVTEAITTLKDLDNFCGVDVSSGVEQEEGPKGAKDPEKIKTFISKAQKAMALEN